MHSFHNIKVLIFNEFDLKVAIHPSKMEVFGGFDPVTGQHYQRHPKRHIILRNTSYDVHI